MDVEKRKHKNRLRADEDAKRVASLFCGDRREN